MVFAVAQSLFGRHTWSIRLLDLGMLCAAVWACQAIAARWMPRTWARWAGCVLVLWYFSGAYWHTAQPDGWVACGMLVSVAWISTAPPSRRWHWPCVGAFAALAVLVKPLYAAFLCVFLLEAWRVGAPGDRRPSLAALAALAAGFAAVSAAFVGWLASRDALDSAIEATWIYPSQVYAGSLGLDPLGRAQGVAEFLRNGTVAAPLCAAAAVGLWWLSRQRPADALRVGSWALASFAIVVAQNRFFTYHWLPVEGPLVLLGFAGLHALYAHAPAGETGDLVRRFGLVSVGVVVLGASIHPLREVAEWARYASGAIDRHRYLDHFGDAPGGDARVAEWLRAETAPQESVVVYGWNASIPFLAGRRSATRFGYAMPLLLGGSALREQYRREFLRELAADPPAAIVVTPPSRQILAQTAELDRFPEFEALLERDYRVAVAFGDLVVHRRDAQ